MLERLWPGRSWGSVLRKVCAVNLVADPIIFFPAFYTLKEWMHTGTLGPESVRVAMRNYRAGLWVDLRNTWSVWFPGHLVTFGACLPLQYIYVHIYLYTNIYYACIYTYNTAPACISSITGPVAPTRATAAPRRA